MTDGRYLPIAEHGMIGDLHTVALVGTDGTIDWFCCPRFDSPSVFGAILDADRGGRFRIAPDGDGRSSRQLYLPDTNILITRFLTPDGVGEVLDFMPPARAGGASPHRQRVIRRVVVVRGRMRFVVDVAPRFDYGRAGHDIALTPHGAVFRSAELDLALTTASPLAIVGGRDGRRSSSFDAVTSPRHTKRGSVDPPRPARRRPIPSRADGPVSRASLRAPCPARADDRARR
jgi:hypothetical protein